jgi:tetratricopeptide (TPR) repeat protein
MELLGRFEEAEKSYRALLKVQPLDVTALTRLANLLVRLNEPEKALPVLLTLIDPRALVPDEDLPDLRRQLALVLTAPEIKTDRLDDAMKLIERNKRDLGDNESDQRVTALVRGRRAGLRAGSLRELEKLGDRAAVVPEEQLRLAQLQDAEGQWPRAREGLLGLINRDRKSPAYLAVLIDGLLRRGKTAEALERIEQMEKLVPKKDGRPAVFRERLQKLLRAQQQ